MTIVAGASSPAPAMVPSVARTVRCSGRVPHWIDAAGVSGRRPPAISRAAIFSMRATPMRTTIVPPT